MKTRGESLIESFIVIAILLAIYWGAGFIILKLFKKEISFALEFENDILSSCVSYIKMWKEIKGEMCERAFERINGIKNLLDVQASSEYKSSFKEISKKIDEYKLNKLMNETSKNNSALTDTFSKLNFLLKNL